MRHTLFNTLLAGVWPVPCALLFGFRWTWAASTESPVSRPVILLGRSLHWGPSCMGSPTWDTHLFFLGILDFRGGVWSWRWGCRNKERAAFIFWIKQAPRNIKPSRGSQLAQLGAKLEALSKDCWRLGSLQMGWVIWMTSLGFLHTLVSGLVWSLPEGEENGLASGFGSLW